MLSFSKLQNLFLYVILISLLNVFSSLKAESFNKPFPNQNSFQKTDATEDDAENSDPKETPPKEKETDPTGSLNIDDPRTLTEEWDGVSSYERRKRKDLTLKERQEIDYDLSVKKGILTVFRAETEKRYKTLDRIALTHPIPRVRAAAVLAIGRMGKGGIKTLHQVIEKDGEAVRQAAYRALADLGSPSSLNYFLVELNLAIQIFNFPHGGEWEKPKTLLQEMHYFGKEFVLPGKKS